MGGMVVMSGKAAVGGKGLQPDARPEALFQARTDSKAGSHHANQLWPAVLQATSSCDCAT